MIVGRITNLTPPSDPWEALDALRSPFALKPRPANSFTVQEYCARYGIKRSSARAQLAALVDSGKLCSQQAVVNGRGAAGTVYWIPGTETRDKSRGKK
jgi:hypothetical protein